MCQHSLLMHLCTYIGLMYCRWCSKKRLQQQQPASITLHTGPMSIYCQMSLILYHLIAIGFPDPGTLSSCEKTIQRSLGNVSLLEKPHYLSFPCFMPTLLQLRHVVASTLSPVITGVHPPAFADLLCHHHCYQKFFKSCQINSHICLSAKRRIG